MDLLYASADLYHFSGLRVRVNFPIAEQDPEIYLSNVIDAYLSRGWKIEAPGTEPGEEKEEVGFCLRTTVDGRNGPCSRIFFYSPNAAAEYQIGSVYLNEQADIAEFEKQSGISVSRMQEWPSSAAPKKDERNAERFIVKAPRPFSIVRKANPKYYPALAEASKKPGAAAYTVPKRLFVRYGSQASGGEKTPQTHAGGEYKGIDFDKLSRRIHEGTDRQSVEEAVNEADQPDAQNVHHWEAEIEAAADRAFLKTVGVGIKDDRVLTRGGKDYLRSLWDAKYKALEKMESNQDIPW